LALIAGCSDVEYATFYVTRGILKSRLGGEDAGADFQRAVTLDGGSWRNRHALTDHLAKTGQHEAALSSARAGAKDFPGQTVCAMDLASALYASGDYAGTLRELSAMRVLPYEGSWEAHDLFVRANLEIALARMAEGKWGDARAPLEASRTFPESLGTGEPYEPDTRIQEMLLALCDEKSGMVEEGRRKRAGVAAYTERHRLSWGREHCFGVHALMDVGKSDAAGALLEEWVRTTPADPMALWTRASMDRNAQSLEILKSRYRDNAWFRIRSTAFGLLGGR
jgi:hypothetical protein